MSFGLTRLPLEDPQEEVKFSFKWTALLQTIPCPRASGDLTVRCLLEDVKRRIHGVPKTT